MDRKKKLKYFQILLFFTGLSTILFTYYESKKFNQKKIIPDSLKNQLISQDNQDGNIFYNVRYTGLDLEGNRFTITSNEAINSSKDANLVLMKGVIANFFFKDDTNLKVESNIGEYNNQTLDIKFAESVKAFYLDSQLNAEKAEFSNSENYLTVSDNVQIIDKKGTIFADLLIFDIKTKKLKIKSLNKKKIKSEIKYK